VAAGSSALQGGTKAMQAAAGQLLQGVEAAGVEDQRAVEGMGEAAKGAEKKLAGAWL